MMKVSDEARSVPMTSNATFLHGNSDEVQTIVKAFLESCDLNGDAKISNKEVVTSIAPVLTYALGEEKSLKVTNTLLLGCYGGRRPPGTSDNIANVLGDSGEGSSIISAQHIIDSIAALNGTEKSVLLGDIQEATHVLRANISHSFSKQSLPFVLWFIILTFVRFVYYLAYLYLHFWKRNLPFVRIYDTHEQANSFNFAGCERDASVDYFKAGGDNLLPLLYPFCSFFHIVSVGIFLVTKRGKQIYAHLTSKSSLPKALWDFQLLFSVGWSVTIDFLFVNTSSDFVTNGIVEIGALINLGLFCGVSLLPRLMIASYDLSAEGKIRCLRERETLKGYPVVLPFQVASVKTAYDVWIMLEATLERSSASSLKQLSQTSTEFVPSPQDSDYEESAHPKPSMKPTPGIIASESWQSESPERAAHFVPSSSTSSDFLSICSDNRVFVLIAIIFTFMMPAASSFDEQGCWGSKWGDVFTYLLPAPYLFIVAMIFQLEAHQVWLLYRKRLRKVQYLTNLLSLSPANCQDFPLIMTLSIKHHKQNVIAWFKIRDYALNYYEMEVYSKLQAALATVFLIEFFCILVLPFGVQMSGQLALVSFFAVCVLTSDILAILLITVLVNEEQAAQINHLKRARFAAQTQCCHCDDNGTETDLSEVIDALTATIEYLSELDTRTKLFGIPITRTTILLLRGYIVAGLTASLSLWQASEEQDEL